MSRHRLAILSLCLLTGCLATTQGCVKYHEQKEVDQERRQLEQQRQSLYDAINGVTGGKANLTEAEKARVRPLWIEVRKIDDRLKNLHVGLQDP